MGSSRFIIGTCPSSDRESAGGLGTAHFCDPRRSSAFLKVCLVAVIMAGIVLGCALPAHAKTIYTYGETGGAVSGNGWNLAIVTGSGGEFTKAQEMVTLPNDVVLAVNHGYRYSAPFKLGGSTPTGFTGSNTTGINYGPSRMKVQSGKAFCVYAAGTTTFDRKVDIAGKGYVSGGLAYTPVPYFTPNAGFGTSYNAPGSAAFGSGGAVYVPSHELRDLMQTHTYDYYRAAGVAGYTAPQITPNGFASVGSQFALIASPKVASWDGLLYTGSWDVTASVQGGASRWIKWTGVLTTAQVLAMTFTPGSLLPQYFLPDDLNQIEVGGRAPSGWDYTKNKSIAIESYTFMGVFDDPDAIAGVAQVQASALAPGFAYNPPAATTDTSTPAASAESTPTNWFGMGDWKMPDLEAVKARFSDLAGLLWFIEPVKAWLGMSDTP